MKEIKEIILAIQILSGGAALFRIAYLLLMSVQEDDKTPVKRKIKNIIIILIFIETITGFALLIKKYYS